MGGINQLIRSVAMLGNVVPGRVIIGERGYGNSTPWIIIAQDFSMSHKRYHMA